MCVRNSWSLFCYKDAKKTIFFYILGEVIIHIECMESTEKIFLHSVDHDIKYISIENRTEKVEVTEWWQNEGLQMLLLKTSFMLMAGEKYILTIRSTSRISGSLRGFYYSPYNEGNQTKYVIEILFTCIKYLIFISLVSACV